MLAVPSVLVLLGFNAMLAAPAPISGGMTERPLAPRPAGLGRPLFVEVPADQTGIVTTNNFADPKMWSDLNREFEVGAMGTGVAIGDYDGDGRPDIFVVSKTETCRLFRNLGNWKFEDVTEKAGVEDKGDAAAVWKQGATFVDINNDGRLDIYVCRFNAPNLLYINQGDGTFKESAHAYGLDVKDACVMAAFCDYDRDGALDVFIQTNLLDYNRHPIGQKNYLFHNNRDGTFSNVTDRAGIAGEAQGHSATWWDFNNDGWPDLYVANDFAQPDKLYRNNGDGTFTNVIDEVVPHMPFSAMGSDLGDVNNDGLIDLFVAEMAATTHEKDQRGMANVRAQAREIPDNSNEAPQVYHNALYLNTGASRVLEAAYLSGLAATDWTWSVRWEDLDNDGRLDLFATNGMHREAANVDLLARQMRAETAPERIAVLRNSPVMAQAHLAFRNLGDLRFEDVSAAWGLDKRGVSFGAAFGDLDGDGNLDLVYSNYQGGVTVLRNQGVSGHRLLIDLRGVKSNRFGVGATVSIESASGRQVRQLVLARGYMSSSEPMLHFGLGTDDLVKNLKVTWPSGRTQVFNNIGVDRRLTITEPEGATQPVSVEKGAEPSGSGPFFTEASRVIAMALPAKEDEIDEAAIQPLLPFRLNRRGPSLAIADLNGDGVDDLVIGGTTRTPLQILLGSAEGAFTLSDAPALSQPGPVDDGPVLLFDADGTGAMALLVTRGGDALPAGSKEYQPRLYLNSGDGKLRAAPEDALPRMSIDAGAAVAGDFDRDGRLDLFIGARLLPGQYPEKPRSALLVNHGGKFEDVTDAVAPGLREVGMVTSALWTDVDGDGWLDLLVTLDWGNVKYFHNDKGRKFEDWSEKGGFAAAGSGWWTSLAAGDFNGDGRPDYVVGNAGLNTPYHADPEHPALLFYGDFNGKGEQPQLVEAYYENGRLYPRRSRKELSTAIPSILKRYPRNDFYARATLSEILGQAKLEAAARYTATELRSGVFLSQPDGRFKFEALPRSAQLAPFQGIIASDLDGDGLADIFAVQNAYGPVPATGRFDGGLGILLKGDGSGHFAPVSLVKSGLVVPGDAKSLVLLNGGRADSLRLVVSRNNSSPLLFRRSAEAGHRLFRIRLNGRKGNPTGIGARITVQSADGRRQTAEVYSGGGYMSQSGADCFFGFSEAAPIVSIRVQWPSGTVVEQRVPAGTTHLDLFESH